MAYQIILSALAQQELELAVDWYEEREEGLGKRFIDAIDSRLRLLSQTPELFRIKSSGYNEVLVEKFPYLIVYKILKKTKKVRILHVFHTSRDHVLKK